MKNVLKVHNPNNLPTMPYTQFVEFQGDLKEQMTPEDLEKMRGSLKKHGVFVPKFVWFDEQQHANILDGHQTKLGLSSLEEDGWTIPEIPYAQVEAENRQDAAEKLLQINSRYAMFNSHTTWFDELDLPDISSLLDSVVIPELSSIFDDISSFDNLFDMPDANVNDLSSDEMPEAKESITKVGDLWQLGEHRLLCGDATITNEKKILGKKTASFVFGELPSDDFIDEFSPTLPKTCTPPKKNVVMYSGGKDSLAMLLTMKKHNIPIHHIISFHAGSWEWDTLEQHHKDVERYFDVKIEWIQGGDAIEKGFKKYGFPQLFARWCNTIKVKMLNKYVKEQFGGEENIMQFVGIAYSERERLMADHYRKFHYRFPLIEYKITEDEALDLCQKEGFTFGGIYEKQHRLSCWCCPMTRDAYIFDIIQDRKRLDILREMQKQSPTPFKLPHKTIYWFEHEYWSRYGRNGESKTVDVFSRNDKSDKAILQKTQEYITKKTQERDIILCFDGNSHDVFWACIATNRLFYGIESSPKYCDFLVNTWEQYTGKQATLAD